MPVYRVLHVEDSATDAALIERTLRRGGIDAEIHRVMTKADFITALEPGGWDAVLSDCELPGFSGAEALHLTRWRNRALPFIVVSGAVGEEEAAGLIRLGANDFVSKTNLVRLPVTLIREIRDSAARAERRQLWERLELMSMAVTQSASMVIITDAGGVIQYVNPKFTEISGYRLDELAGCTPRTLKSGLAAAETYASLWRTIKDGRSWHGDLINRRKDGTLYYASVSIGPVVNAEGFITHFVGIQEDVTARKRAEVELIAAKEAAERANQAKTVFLSHMSHELRTPLTAILGYSEMMEEEIAGPLGDVYQSYANCVSKGGRHLLSIIDELLDLSCIELGNYKVALVELDLAALVDECIAMTLPQAKTKGLTLAYRRPEPMTVRTDGRALRQVLTNLIGNSIKYTADGGTIAVTIERSGESVMLRVQDDGQGIPADQMDAVFEPFHRVNPMQADPSRGVGLGLAICRRVVGLLGGRVWIESTLGIGTTAIVALDGQIRN